MSTSRVDLIADRSRRALSEVPGDLLALSHLRMLYLEGNALETLPEGLFEALPGLTWLDLRNNRLRALPAAAGAHRCLENLLVANNQLEKLPTELGLAPALKNLLVSGNPLVYPSQYIVDKGTDAILEYLRKEHAILHPDNPDKTESEAQTVRQQPKTPPKPAQKLPIQELLQAASRAAASGVRCDASPVIRIKSLSAAAGESKKMQAAVAVKRRHKMTKSCSKVTLRSSISSAKPLKARNQKEDAEMKQVWLARLKGLLEEQSKILQQEKNLKAMASWRFAKKTEPLQKRSDPARPPFATDEGKEVAVKTEKADVQKMIADVVSQLKHLETACDDVKSPRSEIENAGRQIETILQLHKKIAQAKFLNDKS